ncbi:mutator type transposase [Tanacetum coccineum]
MPLLSPWIKIEAHGLPAWQSLCQRLCFLAADSLLSSKNLRGHVGLSGSGFLPSAGLAKWAIELGEHDIIYKPRLAVKGLTLYTDEAFRSDGSGEGLILTAPDGKEITYALRFDFPTSNNEAEYEALIADPKHDLSIVVVEVHEHDLDGIDYDSFGSDLDDGIDSVMRTQLRELRKIGKEKNQGSNKLRARCEGAIPALVPFVGSDTAIGKNVFSQTKGGPVIREKNISDHYFSGIYQRALDEEDYSSSKSDSKDYWITYSYCDYIVYWNGGSLYQVTGPYKDQCIVNMDRMVCSCRNWELTVIPCKHDVAAIYNMFENRMGVGILEHWVDAAYRLGTWAHVVQVKLVVLVNRVNEQDKLLVQGMSLVKLLVLVNKVKHQDKLLVQGMPQVKLVVLVNKVKDQDKVLVQGMPQVKLLVLVNLVQHQAKQAKDQVNIVQDQLKQFKDLGKVFKHQDQLQVLDHKD